VHSLLASFTQKALGDPFRGLREWTTMFLQLRAEQIRTVSVETAHAAVGTTALRRAPGVFDAWRGGPPLLLDVRSADAFSAARPAGAVSAPCYPEFSDPLNELDWACVMGFGRLPAHDGRFVAHVDRLVGGNKVCAGSAVAPAQKLDQC
jgi:hypothetical protein